MLQPKLRFAIFKDTEWLYKKIGNILTIKHGKDYKNISRGNIPVLGTGGEITKISKFLCDWPCVLIGRKGTIDHPQFMDKPFWAVDTLFFSKPEDCNDPKFLYYLFQTINWKKYNEASGVPSLSASTIENIEVAIPSLKEQQKIAFFFSTLDVKISINERKLETLEQLKKSLMQKIFSQELRFKDENGEDYPEWTLTNFFDLIDSITDFRGRTPKKLGLEWSPTPTEHLALSALNVKNWGIDYTVEAHYGDKVLYNKWMSGNELYKGQVLLTTEAPAGIVMQVPDNRKYILSQRLLALNVNKYKASENFLAHLLRSNSIQQNLKKLSTGGTALGISQKSLKDLWLYHPASLEEQQKIASFFSTLDEKNSLTRRKLETLNQLKKGFMQQMFV